MSDGDGCSGGGGGVRRSQSVKCGAVVSPDLLAELRTNRQFRRQEEKHRGGWEERKSVSLEDLRMVAVQEKLERAKNGGSEAALNETKSSKLAALMGRKVSGFLFWCG